MANSIGKQTSEAILQKPLRVRIGRNEYQVAPPSIATLVKVSEYLDGIPPFSSIGERLNETLAYAKDSFPVMQVAATLILGAKAIREDENSRKWGSRKSLVDKLAEELMYECSPKQLYDIVLEILKTMQVSDFFALSVSLREISLIQKTRGAETASGQ